MKTKFYFRQAKSRGYFYRLSFLFLGIASTLWFLFRVIPKPSRAGYPCMRAAAPIMSGFVIYLISLASSVLFYKKFKQNFILGKYGLASILLLSSVFVFLMSESIFNSDARASQLVAPGFYIPNEPIGEPKGVQPGRVVWVWNQDATDESCTNTENDYWFDNTNAAVVDDMLDEGIQNLAGEDNTEQAWDALFRYFNNSHGNGDHGYTSGEKIFVKINLTNSCCNRDGGTAQVSNWERMDATPELVLSMIKQLVEKAGVAQEDIYIGDPFRVFRDRYYNLCHASYPNVNYCDGHGMNGRYQVHATTAKILKFSDDSFQYRIPQEYVDASYFINMPCLKSHESGGITIAAKNHQGSMLQDNVTVEGQSAYTMHYSLPEQDYKYGTHRYRHLVDYMGHEHVGGKTLFSVVDGIWAGKNWQGYLEKWQMQPFGNDYPNSLFLSQDPVAIESVCWDFLLAEYADKNSSEQFPYMEGAGDFIIQAADPTQWAEGIIYDPEGDGTKLASLGVHEHWSNASDMEYTAIDFIKVFMEPREPEVLVEEQGTTINLSVYPNPANGIITVSYSTLTESQLSMSLYNLNGQLVKPLFEGNSVGELRITTSVENLPSGIYFIKLYLENTEGALSGIQKVNIN